MNNKIKTAQLCISGEMSIYRAVELKEALLDVLGALKASDVLELDLSEVTEFDASGLQLVMMAKRISSKRGIKLKLINCSAAVHDVFALLHLDSQGSAGKGDSRGAAGSSLEPGDAQP